MSDAAPSIPLLLNPGGGSAPADPAAFAARLDPRLHVRTVSGAGIAAATREALAAGAPVVAVAGGDGTLRSAAEVLLDSGAALAVVPAGTLNHFARRIGIEGEADAAAALRAGAVQNAPVGTFGEHLFLNTLTFGEYARVLRVRGRWRRYLGKWPAALVGFANALVRGRRFTVTLQLEDRTVTRRTALVWIGVGRGSFPLVHEAPAQRVPDLEVAVLRAHGAGAAAFLLRLSARLVRRELPVRDRALEIFRARELTLHARHRVDATADGEIFRLVPPVRIQVRPEGLRVRLPSQDAANA